MGVYSLLVVHAKMQLYFLCLGFTNLLIDIAMSFIHGTNIKHHKLILCKHLLPLKHEVAHIKILGQSGHRCPGCLHWKHMITVVSLGCWAVETLGVGSKQNEFVSGGLGNVVGGH
jgi:hypothetical protein